VNNGGKAVNTYERVINSFVAVDRRGAVSPTLLSPLVRPV